MDDLVAPVRQDLFTEALSASRGQVPDRMRAATSLLLNRGVSPEVIVATTTRIQALGELLRSHPSLCDQFAESTIIRAGATCRLVRPPMNPAGGDSVDFHLDDFRQSAVKQT